MADIFGRRREDHLDEEEQRYFEGLRRDKKRVEGLGYICLGIHVNEKHALYEERRKDVEKTASHDDEILRPVSRHRESTAFRLDSLQDANREPKTGTELITLTKPQFALVCNPKSLQFHVAQVTQDSGTKYCWISPTLAAECQLRMADSNSGIMFDFQGNSFESRKSVTITLIGRNKNKTENCTCFVGPKNAPFALLVGEEYFNKKGWVTFLEASGTNSGLIFCAKNLTKPEAAAIEAGRAYADAIAAKLNAKKNTRKASENMD
ncbi:uncharacterized protein BCR38DRAFT_175087 [Pseudomassariella vexata]|uniref:Uncharacterized protein n=1 Tax=Pseudomassariella vexata TaxID=1141098 RepID=A0A1Y2E4C7_9PEZI|nr:uncharacterized protein BCR38DRAFT_175087 [Pseudomassariella vexata]ORY66204.1 hypothetical protein BCR38DRAFT_175087 [Pseudomassariella vexata]